MIKLGVFVLCCSRADCCAVANLLSKHLSFPTGTRFAHAGVLSDFCDELEEKVSSPMLEDHTSKRGPFR